MSDHTYDRLRDELVSWKEAITKPNHALRGTYIAATLGLAGMASLAEARSAYPLRELSLPTALAGLTAAAALATTFNSGRRAYAARRLALAAGAAMSGLGAVAGVALRFVDLCEATLRTPSAATPAERWLHAATLVSDQLAAQPVSWGLPVFLGAAIPALALRTPTIRKRFIEGPLIELGGPRRRHSDEPASATFLDHHAMEELSLNATGLVLGQRRRRLMRYKPGRGWPAGHHLVIAGTRGGKGVYCVVPALLTHQGSVAALDPKGELFPITRRGRLAKGRTVYVMNPFDVHERCGIGWEPLRFVRERTLEADVDLIAEGTIKPELGTGDHFSTVARHLIAAALEVVYRTEPPERRKFLTAIDLIGSPDLLQTLEAWSRAPDTVGLRPAKMAATLLSMSDKERGGVISTAAKGTRWADATQMRTFLSGDDVDFDAVVAGKADVFFVLPEWAQTAYANFLRLGVSLLFATVTRREVSPPKGTTLLTVLEELSLLGRLEVIKDVVQRGAGPGMQAMLVVQDLGSLQAIWGEEAFSMAAGCATVRALSLGAGDIKTAEWLSRISGTRTYEAWHRTANAFFNPHDSRSEQRAPLIQPEEILNMEEGMILLVVRGRGVGWIRGAPYYEHPAFKGLFDPPPTPLM